MARWPDERVAGRLAARKERAIAGLGSEVRGTKQGHQPSGDAKTLGSAWARRGQTTS